MDWPENFALPAVERMSRRLLPWKTLEKTKSLDNVSQCSENMNVQKEAIYGNSGSTNIS